MFHSWKKSQRFWKARWQANYKNVMFVWTFPLKSLLKRNPSSKQSLWEEFKYVDSTVSDCCTDVWVEGYGSISGEWKVTAAAEEAEQRGHRGQGVSDRIGMEFTASMCHVARNASKRLSTQISEHFRTMPLSLVLRDGKTINWLIGRERQNSFNWHLEPKN